MSLHRVLNTAELLEAILLQVDMHTLLTSCQCVNKQFKQVIDKSPKLQQKLFFQSSPAFTDNIDYVNPLIKKHREKLGIHWFLDNLKIRFYEDIGDLMLPEDIELKSKIFAVYLLFKNDKSIFEDTDITPSWRRMLPMQTGRKDRLWLVGKQRSQQHDDPGHGLESYVQIVPRLGSNVVSNEELLRDGRERRHRSTYSGRMAIGDWDFDEHGQHNHFSPHMPFCNSMGYRAKEPTMGEILDFICAGTSEALDEDDMTDGLNLRSVPAGNAVLY